MLSLYDKLKVECGERGLPTRFLLDVGNHANALLRLGKVEESLNLHSRCVAALRARIEKDPRSDLRAELALGLNNLSVAQDEHHEPDAAFRSVTEAIDIYRSLIGTVGRNDLDVDLARARRNQAMFHMKRGETAQDLELKRRETAQGLKILGDVADSYHDLTQGGKRRDLEPEYADLLLDKGRAHRQHGNIANAVEDLTAASRLLQTLVSPGGRDLRQRLAGSFVALGSALVDQGRPGEALPLFDQALSIYRDPAEKAGREDLSLTIAECLTNRGTVLSMLRRHRQAIQSYEAALESLRKTWDTSLLAEQEISFAHVKNQLAWLYATCEDGSLWNGRLAIDLARQASEHMGGRDVRCFDTLAAAHARSGDFTSAVEWQSKALEGVLKTDTATLQDYRSRLEQYRAGRAYIEMPGNVILSPPQSPAAASSTMAIGSAGLTH
jgi:tetratricopeptide (TPR) repeat protein